METKKFSPKIGGYELSDMFMQQVKGGTCDTTYTNGSHSGTDKNVENSSTYEGNPDGDIEYDKCKD